jgi:hypothetical protein
MKMPKSVSGYSLCATTEEEFQRPANGMPMSASSYSMASGLETLETFFSSSITFSNYSF